MWLELFGLLGKGLDLAKSLVGGGSKDTPSPVEDTENPAAAREGTAAGAAANLASHNPRRSNEVSK
jgi:hypothetical protein